MRKTSSKRIIIIISLVLCTILNLNIYAKAESRKNILIIHSYAEDFKWTNTISEGITSVLNDVDKFNLMYTYIDSKRFNSSSYIESLRNLCKIKYEHTKFDAIICSDNDALNFLVKYGDELFPNVPVVFCGINGFTKSMLNGHRNYTGVLESIDIESTIKTILKLQPNVKNIVVVCDSSFTGKLNEEDTRNVIKNIRLPVNFQFCRDVDINLLSKTVKKLGDNTSIFHIGQIKDIDGNFINYENIAPLLNKNINAANYICWDFALGNGMVGGKVLNSIEHGRLAAQMVIKILNGEKTENIPIIGKSVSSYTFDYQKLNALKIDIDKLPDGSTIINKTPSFYELYKKLVWTVIVIITTLLVFIVILSINVKKRK